MFAQRSMRRLPRLLVAAAAAVLAVGVAVPSAAPRATAVLPYEDSSRPVSVRVADLLSRMTLEEKVGQMTQAERGAVTDDPTRITAWMLGSVLSGGGSPPTPNTPEAWADMVDRFQQAALNTRLGIPLLYGVDSVHGHGNLFGATVFPHNIGLGATRDPDLVRSVEHITAIETRASGPQWTFAPCVCAARDDRWGRTYESFSEDPDLVIRMETAIDGFQGRRGELDDRDRVLATAKHYAGDGDTEFDTAAGDYTIDQGIAITNRQVVLEELAAPVPAGRAEARRRHRDAVVLERRLDRGRPRQPDQDAREPRADHRRPQGRDGLRRVRHQRLGGHPPDPGRLGDPGPDGRRTPASTCSWSPSRRRASRRR